MFGHTWTSGYGPKPHGIGGDTWAAALGGISGAQLAEGLRATLMLGGEFPPSAPKFRSLCFGIPSIANIRAEFADRNAERTPFATLVWSKLDAHRYRTVDADKAGYMLREAYELARDHVMRGGPLPDAPAGLIAAPVAEVRKPAPPEVAAAYMAELRERLHIDEAQFLPAEGDAP